MYSRYLVSSQNINLDSTLPVLSRLRKHNSIFVYPSSCPVLIILCPLQVLVYPSCIPIGNTSPVSDTFGNSAQPLKCSRPPQDPANGKRIARS